MHLLIPFACLTDPAAHQALKGAALPNLEKLLARMTEVDVDQGDSFSLSPPHEKAQAQILGFNRNPSLKDGCYPWAAWDLVNSGRKPGNEAWAWVSPCHWTVNSDHIVMDDPQALDLTEAESRTLLEAVRPYFEEDGIGIDYAKPDRWLARSELFRGMASASVDRVAGSDIDGWLPKTPQAAPLRRLQNEMQMLLYTQPVNDARAASGLQTVNSFWVSGTGALPEGTPSAPAPSEADSPVIASDLRDAAIRRDWDGWIQAWKTLDATHCAVLLREVVAGNRALLTLCGERSAITFDARSTGFLNKIVRHFGHYSLYLLRDQL